MPRAGERPVLLRNSIEIADPVAVALAFFERYGPDSPDASAPAAFGEADLRRANRGGARIAATEIAAILERRSRIERALRAIAPEASLAGTSGSVPWLRLRQLFDQFADIRGVGHAKVTKALHPRRPALIPLLDSVVQAYLTDDDPSPRAPFGDRAIALVRGYKRDLDRNRAALRATGRQLAKRGHNATEVRILDVLIWSVETAA